MARRLIVTFVIAGIVIDLLLSLFMAESTLHPYRKTLTRRDHERAEGLAQLYNATKSDVQIRAADKVKLHGWFFRKGGEAIVLLHGQADNRAGMLPYAELFLKNGISVLVPDSRAHGESEGEFASYGFLEANDINRWIQFLIGEQKITDVYGLGESMGAAILLFSLEKETRLKAVMAESSFSSFTRIAGERTGPPWLEFMILKPAFLYTAIRYNVDLTQVNPQKAISLSTTPILLIHGANDRSIAPHHSESLAKSRSDIHLWLVPDAGHTGAMGKNPEEFEKRVMGFIATAKTPSL